MATLRFVTPLSAPADVVWTHATLPAGINRELGPLMKMTFPKGIETLDEDTVPIGEPICTSWFLLFGCVPIDRARVTLKQIGPGHRFVEESPLLSMKLWRHTREVCPTEHGSEMADLLEFEPRWPIPTAAVSWLIRRIFTHRHSRLRRAFG